MNEPTPPAAPTPREQAVAILSANPSLRGFGEAIRLLRDNPEAIAAMLPALDAAINHTMLRWAIATGNTGIA